MPVDVRVGALLDEGVHVGGRLPGRGGGSGVGDAGDGRGGGQGAGGYRAFQQQSATGDFGQIVIAAHAACLSGCGVWGCEVRGSEVWECSRLFGMTNKI
ncbi:hypothetical protein GCM10022233_25050 [Streptomyces shaanxiensis]|uniref:Uncharacterized protein n=1 Tax=Streptomyces shaanxiensis TaxID=653357 RepID=A0ABP7UU11_9ACTN